MKVSVFSKLGQRTLDPPISWLMKMTLDHPEWISLAAGFTDQASLPVAEVRRCVARLMESSKVAQAALQYGSTAGDPRLRQLTAEALRRQDAGDKASARSVYAADRLLITSGSQQLLYMLVESLCDPGDIVLLEDPTYFVFLGSVQSHGLCCRGIPLTGEGLDLEHLERTLAELKRSGDLPRVKMLYLVTYFQNPSGATTSLAAKAAALRLLRRYERAAGHPIYLAEDAAYRELRFAGEEVPSALAVPDSASRVIYTGTYSKPFATGARVGYSLLPEAVLKVIKRIKGNHDFGTANLLQQILAEAITSGEYERLLPRLRTRYAHKAAIMVQALRKHFPPAVTWAEPHGGMYVWAKAPPAIKTGVRSKLFQAALARQVLYVPGEFCYADDPTRRKPNHEMRLSFGGASEEDIRTGIARLGEALQAIG